MTSLRDTPEIPSWIKVFRDERTPPHFLNIFDEHYFPRSLKLHDPTRPSLFSGESMYGRWSDSRVLILAQVAGSKWPFLSKAEGGGGFAWVNDESRPTNFNLRPYADAMPCPKLYGSVLSCLVLNTKKPEERVPLRRLLNEDVRRFVAEVLQWTFSKLPSNQFVVCLGEDSWDLTMAAVGDPSLVGQFTRVRGRPPEVRHARAPATRFGGVYHTSYVQARPARDAEWAPMLDAVRPP